MPFEFGFLLRNRSFFALVSSVNFFDRFCHKFLGWCLSFSAACKVGSLGLGGFVCEFSETLLGYIFRQERSLFCPCAVRAIAAKCSAIAAKCSTT